MRHFFLPLLLTAILSACVSEPVPQSNTNLIVTRAGSSVNMQWQSETDKIYTVLYSDSLSGAKWQILPGAQKLRGTGRLIQLQDNPPAGRPRYYDLHIELAK